MKTQNRLLNLLLVTTITLMLSACNTETSQEESNASAVSTPVTGTTGDTEGTGGDATPNEGSADTTPPRITLNSEASITLEQNAGYTELGATALDGVDGNVSVSINGTVNTAIVGTYTLTYIAQDKAGNETNITRTITVIDVTPPVITLNGQSNITLEHNAVYTELGANAVDAVDGNVSVTISGTVDTSTVGSYTVIYSATDSAGNEANITRAITVIDVTPPVITLNGEATITLEQNAVYTELGATALDVVDGNVSVAMSGTVDTSAAGTYVITYIARDSVGNEANITRTVTVVVPVLTSLSLSISTTTLNVGETTELTLMGTYSNNTSKTVTQGIAYVITPSNSVEVNGTVLTAKKDGTVTVQAKVGTTLSNTIALNITWVVDGHTLPPEPDPTVNNATLLGVDVNDNGVRDDVERWIYETYDEYVPCHQEIYDHVMQDGSTMKGAREVCEEHPIPYHPIVRAVAMQGARAAQIIIQEPERAKETREIFAKAYLCSSVIEDFKDIKIVDKDILGKEFDKVQFNTTKRARAYAKYNYYLSGGVYRMPTDKVILENCPSDVKVLLEELR